MTKKQQAELAILADWIIPVVPRNRILSHCAVVVANEKIISICPQSDLENQFDVKEKIHLPDQVLIPGLINAHGHAAMTLLRGFADDKPLMTWLEKHIWPAEQAFVDESFVYDGTELAIAEMLLSGTTCFSDMYFFPEASAKAAFNAGMRAQLCFPILDFPNNWAKSVDEALEKGLAVHDAYRSHHLISVGLGPHAPYTVADGSLMRIAVYAEELQKPIQIHLHETEGEVTNSVNDYEMRPIERLADLGVMSPLTQCVHMTQVDDKDIEILKHSGSHIIHCPSSNLKLASGICPAAKLLSEGINVALGTDGAASNNDLNMLSEMKTAALIAKVQSKDAEAVNAVTALEMATINGAKAMGLDNEIGSIEVGKYADLTAIDLSGIAQQPVYNPLSQIVYSDVSQSVSNVWVAGKRLVKNRKLTTLDENAVKQKANQWQNQISGTTN